MILAVCTTELQNILYIIRTALKWVCIIIPIILIVMTVMDFAKIITSGDKTDDAKKKAISQTATRMVFAIIIFLVPSLVSAVFGILNFEIDGESANTTWSECWKSATSYQDSLKF